MTSQVSPYSVMQASVNVYALFGNWVKCCCVLPAPPVTFDATFEAHVIHSTLFWTHQIQQVFILDQEAVL